MIEQFIKPYLYGRPYDIAAGRLVFLAFVYRRAPDTDRRTTFVAVWASEGDIH
jgi:hypothetical protein